VIKARFATQTAVLALAALVLAGCSGGTPTDEPSDVELTPEAQAALDLAYEGIGSTLDDLEPTTPPEGLNFYVMSCGEQVATCSIPAAEMVVAAEAAGWTGTVVDGKLNPEGFATAIRQAIAGGADVLVPIGISCGAAAAAFAEAKAAGITIIGGGGIDDCDPKIWDSERLWLEQPLGPTIFHSFGTLAANYAVGRTNGDVKAITVTGTTNVWGPWISESFAAEVERLGGGEILEDIEVSDQEVADNSYVQKVTTALLANPDVNVVYVQTDSFYESGLAAAIDQAGLSAQVIAIGNFAGDGALEMIRNGQPGITATVGLAARWEAWGSIDTAIRILNGQEPAYIGQSMQVIDADNNMPESGGYNGSIDWKAKFLEAWGK
jgi:ribose transport system substrate-binding protein